jgi:hypothetical protein
MRNYLHIKVARRLTDRHSSQARLSGVETPQAQLLHFVVEPHLSPSGHRLEKIMGIYQLSSLIILIADIYAIVMILQSSAKDIEKLIWVLAVLLLPLIGLVIWFFAGPGKKPF